MLSAEPTVVPFTQGLPKIRGVAPAQASFPGTCAKETTDKKVKNTNNFFENIDFIIVGYFKIYKDLYGTNPDCLIAFFEKIKTSKNSFNVIVTSEFSCLLFSMI